jgi:hypothetical protein
LFRRLSGQPLRGYYRAIGLSAPSQNARVILDSFEYDTLKTLSDEGQLSRLGDQLASTDDPTAAARRLVELDTQTLRELIAAGQAASVSRLIDEAGDAGLAVLKNVDDGTSVALVRQFNANRIDSTQFQRISDLLERGEIDQTDLQRFTEMLDDSTVSTESEALLDVAQKGDLSETRRAVAVRNDITGVDSDVIWLENGNDAAGFQHILNRHGTSDQFYAMPGVENPDDVENVIITTIKNGETNRIPEGDGGGTAFEYTRESGDKVTAIVSDNGFIVTARPGAYN